MINFRFLQLCAILLMAVNSPAAGSSEALGGLESGQFEVGFKTILTYDRSRLPIPYSDWDGRLYSTTETKGRQMQIALWYPAQVNETDVKIQFGQYVELMAQQTEFTAMDVGKRKFADDRFISNTNDLGGNGTFTAKKLAILKKLDTNAYSNAKPIDDKFPLIVFPNGGSPASLSVMCEYFASHGFVVAGVALKGEHAFSGGASLKGLETAVSDLDFAIRSLSEMPQVNAGKLGLIGNGNSSSHIVAYQTRNSNVDAVVSLDGGLISQFEQSILKRTPFYEPQAVNIPLLVIYAPHPSIDPIYISDLQYSDRYFFHFPQMSEFHFLNYGAFEKYVPNIIGESKGDVQTGLETASLYSLRFFEAFLSDNKNSLAFLEAEPTGLHSEQINTRMIKRALPLPPNITVIKDAFLEQGFAGIKQIYDELKTKIPKPFSMSFYNDMKDWLAWKRDPEFENRYRLYQLGLDSYPDSATINYHFAYFASETGRIELSKKHDRRALELLETDHSPELTNERKQRMRTVINESLDALKKEGSE